MLAYAGVGGAAAIAEWAAFWLCNGVFGSGIYSATATGLLLGTIVNWFVGRTTMFRKQARSGDFWPVFAVSLIGFGLNFLLMWLLSGIFSIMPLPSKIIATGAVFFWNYIIRRTIIYNPKSY
ncbi:MAG: GtrA family protein [Elusimicrobiota bacterium]|nr:GtrA family protein [Elusimicrobiota bacterium]